jgi:hypothetical protein
MNAFAGGCNKMAYLSLANPLIWRINLLPTKPEL